MVQFLGWNIQEVPLGKIRVLIELPYHLKESRKEHEQGRSSQRGSQGGQYQERGAGSDGALKKKDTVTLIGFGTFKVAQRKARKGRNPQASAEIRISAEKLPDLYRGKLLRMLWVNQYSNDWRYWNGK